MSTSIKKIIGALVALFALIGGGYSYQQYTADTPEALVQDFGADTSVGSYWRKDKNTMKVFPLNVGVITGALTQGGGITASSTVNSAETATASMFDTENVIDYTLNLVDSTLTLPATSTLSSFIPTAGQTRDVIIRNATTTATMDLTLAAGTGMNLVTATSTKVILGNATGSNYALLKFIRKANTDIDVLLDIFLK